MEKVSYSPIYTTLGGDVPPREMTMPGAIDLSDLYTKDELDEIIGRFDCLHPNFPNSDRKCDFSMMYLEKPQCIIIDNLNRTNDTVEIYKNGRAISVGSWHRKDLDGDYSDLINDVKSRVESNKSQNETKLSNDLDALAELGKSQVK